MLWPRNGIRRRRKPVQTSNNVEATLSSATLNDSLHKVECCFDKVEHRFDIFAVLATMSNEISSFRLSRNKLSMFNLFRLYRKDEISRKTRSTLLPFGNKVECCFDKVERCFDIVAGVDGALVIDN